MSTQVEIDKKELDETRRQAAALLPWKNEAERLAKALHQLDPGHSLLHPEGFWKDQIIVWESAAANPDAGRSPAGVASE